MIIASLAQVQRVYRPPIFFTKRTVIISSTRRALMQVSFFEDRYRWSQLVIGSFYTNFPRHRQLISLNKRNTGEKNRKFNLRHDWNSLLADDEFLPFTHRSKQLFPSADLLVEYFNDFYRHYQLRVKLNTTIQNLRPITKESNTCQSNDCSSSATEAEITARFRMNDQHNQQYTCGLVLYFVWRASRDLIAYLLVLSLLPRVCSYPISRLFRASNWHKAMRTYRWMSINSKTSRCSS